MSAWDRVLTGIIRFRRIALALSAAVTVVSAIAALRIPFSSDVSAFLPDDVPEVHAWLQLSRRFDAFDSLLVGLEEPGAGISIEGLTHLQQVTKKLAENKAGGILFVRSLANVDSIREGADGALNNELLVAAIPKDQPGLDALRKRILEDQEVAGALVSRDLRGYAIVIRADPRKDPAAVAGLIERVVEEGRGPVQASFFGAPFFTAVILKRIQAHVLWIAAMFTILLLGLMAGGIRRAPVVLAILVSAAIALVWWLGLVRFFGLGLSQSSLTAVLVLLATGVLAFSAGAEARLRKKDAPATALPFPVASGLAATALACLTLTRTTIVYLASFGATTAAGVLAILLVGIFVFVPAISFLARAPVAQTRAAGSPIMGLAVAFLLIGGGAYVASTSRFLCTPQEMFSGHDEVSDTLAFFDQRFGGTDFIQVGFRGDLRDPVVAARLLRLTDLLEGAHVVSDVRSVGQILGFLNHGFGGQYRIPTARASLANVWFFLEGNPDVRNLVSDKRDEAMVMLRIPSHPREPIAALVARVQSAISTSGELTPAAAHARLAALSRLAGEEAPGDRIDAVIAATAREPDAAEAAPVTAAVLTGLKTYLASPDSPYSPNETEWTQLSTAIVGGPGDLHARVAAATGGMEGLEATGHGEEFVGTVLEHVGDLRLEARSRQLAIQLLGGAPSTPVDPRVQGALADLLDPQPNGGTTAQLTVSGLPVVAGAIEADLKGNLWKALAVLLGVSTLLLLALTMSPGIAMRGLLTASVTTAATLLLCRLLGVQIDSGSATLYLLPALLGFLSAGGLGISGLYPIAGLLGIAAGSVSLLSTGTLPVIRIGEVMAIALSTSAIVLFLSAVRRVGRG
jgi:predicted RND superfamily exporter protein